MKKSEWVEKEEDLRTGVLEDPGGSNEKAAVSWNLFDDL